MEARRLHALVLPPGPRLLQALQAALDGTGPAICPLAPDTPTPALQAILDALAPHAVETPTGTTPRPGGQPVHPDTAVLIATSGTTGTPKFVELPTRALTASATATRHRIGADTTDRWLCCLPTSHIAGIQVLVRALLTGTPPHIHPRFDPHRIATTDATLISLVPTQLRRLLDTGADLTRYRAILLGGAAAPPDLLDRARTAGATVHTTYGMSETSGGCAYDGLPLDGVTLDLDPDGRVRIAGPVLFTGYRLNPDLTRATRDGRWYLTQDLGTLDNGRLRIRGRIDDIINTGGEKVVAGDVAERLTRHPRVADAVVIGRPDPEWGERVTAVIVPDGPAPTLDDLRAWVRETLPAHAAPRELDLRAALPLLPSGKPDRAALRTP
ncbi:AMP-binding protein [Actinomadura rupiterrae]|uniref:AMP-binding protein n=1 Tax=Actinomadura rupiterrae TaxID=559627 RepID=UPI0020A5E706|nr:AMP-binding protein [Actinomadura rupiterrae]MCP2342638.1 O-succinylbenzoic acid--CoA ligase [Actinomadura rupiterrae]